jgi:AcrR family transcriptional regulator
MSPRRSASDALATRDAIVAAAVDRASTDGLEGITIGRLADELAMSKAGVIGHFGSKQALQLEAVAEANAIFRREVWDPVAHRPPGLVRLRALLDRWFAYLEGDVFPGGCFITAASTEFDGRDGPVRDAVADSIRRWHGVLEREARAAVADGDLPAGADPAQIAFELGAIGPALNQARQLLGDGGAGKRARRAVDRILAAHP